MNSEIYVVRHPFKIVLQEQIYPFTQNLLAWYANQDETLPNVFNLFEYPDYHADAVIRSLINFQAQRLYGEHFTTISTAIHNAIEHYKNQTPFINACLEDVRIGLDMYHLSYQYKELNEKPIYYNTHIEGVW